MPVHSCAERPGPALAASHAYCSPGVELWQPLHGGTRAPEPLAVIVRMKNSLESSMRFDALFHALMEFESKGFKLNLKLKPRSI